MKLKTWQKIILILFGFLVFLRVISKPAPEHPYYADGLNYPLVIAHQGGDRVWPGNTLYAFEKAVEIGADVLEMDAHITKDSEIVLMHDERVDRTTDGTGLIQDMTLAELLKLDAAYQWSNDDGKTFPYRGRGIQAPTLKELFQKFPEKRFLIEIKLTKNSIAKPFCDLIHEYNMQDKVIVASFHDDAMALFRETCPDIATSGSKGEVTPFILLGKVFLSGWLSPKYQSLQVPYETSESYGIPIMTERFIREAHAKNIHIEPWTVDDPELMKKYMDWGVDGIITDRPDLMMEILGR